MIDLARELGEKLSGGGRLWLFLDYDGTLADFAPTPDWILPDPDLIDLLSRLAEFPDLLRVVIMSGRQYRTIQTLLPVPGILSAGTYGVEYQTWQGEQVRLLDIELARPMLERVKEAWAAILDGQEGFFLEDKGYSLAIHARFAPEEKGKEALARAEAAALQILADGAAAEDAADETQLFHILGGDRFLEVAPLIANKGQSVKALLERFPWPGADIVYIGDDDKDEEAFKVLVGNNGSAILVAPVPRDTAAQYRLNNPGEVRDFLRELLTVLEHPFAP
jgi:trehalose 6-phosphate phosphatase